MRLGKQVLESSQRPVSMGHSKSQLSTRQLNEASQSRSPLTESPIPSSVNYSTSQTNTGYFDGCSASQGNLNILEDPLSATSFLSGPDHRFETRDLSTLGDDSLENFFEKFLDVNFPISLSDQLFGGYDALR